MARVSCCGMRCHVDHDRDEYIYFHKCWCVVPTDLVHLMKSIYGARAHVADAIQEWYQVYGMRAILNQKYPRITDDMLLRLKKPPAGCDPLVRQARSRAYV